MQNRFLHELGISLEKGLLDFNLAPLCVRRDIANLGIIHRSLLGKGPKHFHSFFVLDNSSQYYGTRSRSRHTRYLRDPYRDMGRDYVNRSLLGYIAVYNLLPDFAIEARDVKTFQSRLSRILKDYVRQGNKDWSYLYSARIPLFNFHPLRHIWDFSWWFTAFLTFPILRPLCWLLSFSWLIGGIGARPYHVGNCERITSANILRIFTLSWPIGECSHFISFIWKYFLICEGF